MRSKRLARFYCVDCDMAWTNLISEFEHHDNCEYCNKSLEAEEISEK